MPRLPPWAHPKQQPSATAAAAARGAVVIDSDSDDDQFDPDAGLADTRFGAPDPMQYVDADKANENIKQLLEGAFEEEEEATKRKKLPRKGKKPEVKEEKKRGLAERLESLEVAKNEETPASKPVEDEEEDDGSVDGLNVKLLPHQIDGVAWMIEKELGLNKKKGIHPMGGILADDVSLGY